MLKINDKEYEIVNSEIKLIESTYNKNKVFSALISIDIELNNTKGYISFYVDFFNDNKITNIENKEYIETPTDLDSKISMIEIFDTENFIDYIDSEIILKFGNIENNKIKTDLYINDKLIKLEYSDLLNINN